MIPNIVHEYQSLRVIRSIARVYRTSSPQSKQIIRDLRHVIATYDLCDRDTALACNRYITSKYPIIYEVAVHYDLHPMSEADMLGRTTSELQHMLYCLGIFLYDRLRMQAVNSRFQSQELPL